MPIDYSKWDKLELSDDEDFECHPNVDKASFIRWKQAEIHRKREERREKIETLKKQIAQDDELLVRIDDMIQQVESEGVDVFSKKHEELQEASQKKDYEQEMKEREAWKNNVEPLDFPPKPLPTLDDMMEALFKNIKDELEMEKLELVSENLVEKLRFHRNKLADQQQIARRELATEEAEAKKKITMDDIHTGFDKTAVTKVTKPELPKPTKKTEKKTQKVIEVLNPNAKLKPLDEAPKKEENLEDEDEEIVMSDIAREFSKIKDYEGSYKYISKHPEVVNQEIVDQILAEAFQSQLKGKAKYSKQCVHQAWLLQYCQQLGKDGVTLFFKRITSPEAQEQARKIFNNDVEETYARIIERCKVMEEEKKKDPKQTEQIQIEVVDPNSSIMIRIPKKDSEDPTEKEAYETYLTLPNDFRDALETGELAKINKELGKMPVELAENVLQIVGEAGVLSIEEGVIDTTKGETIEAREAAAATNAAATANEDSMEA
ncbi:11753_t:CDS:2 [Ambispora leptoticha]|uniref:Hsp90 chaperone protein kinase-targeting subunit n=1 Tax=Ambispora leptoticha TaxID=144679 RepID=A0A9N9GMT6_9GLOM|nr:11753_t:CDS:2 [Ambispora leptoticha]